MPSGDRAPQSLPASVGLFPKAFPGENSPPSGEDTSCQVSAVPDTLLKSLGNCDLVLGPVGLAVLIYSAVLISFPLPEKGKYLLEWGPELLIRGAHKQGAWLSWESGRAGGCLESTRAPHPCPPGRPCATKRGAQHSEEPTPAPSQPP